MQNSFISLISTSIFLDTIFTTCTKFLDCSSLVSFDDRWKPSSQCFLTLISLSFQRNRSSYGSKICGCQVKRTRDGNRLSLAIFLTNDLISKIKSLRKPTWSSETFFFFSKNLDLTSTISRRFIFADVSQLPFAHATRSNTVGKPYCGNALWKVNAEERSDTWFKWDVERKASLGSNQII